MTWRKRSAAAKARKARGKVGFTTMDRYLAGSRATCAVGKAMGGVRGYMLYVRTVLPGEEESDFGMSGLAVAHSHDFTVAVIDDDDPDAAEQLLDAIEDRALRLKREMGA